MRIATWNLDRPKRTGIRRDRLTKLMSEIEADVWVLTETHHELSPGADFRCISHSEKAGDRGPEEHWTAIWVRDSLEATKEPSRDSERTACVRMTGKGAPLYIYGTVLPWLADQRRRPTTGVAAFQEALAEQLEDWCRLRHSRPDAALCVAGDLNQSLAFSGRCHGSAAGERALQSALRHANLTCLTGGAQDPVAALEGKRASIDHICIGGIMAADPQLRIWPELGQLGRGLTDHYGVVATLDLVPV